MALVVYDTAIMFHLASHKLNDLTRFGYQLDFISMPD